MKRLVLALAGAFCVLLLLAGCVPLIGSGNIITVEKDFEDFTEVHAAYGCTLTVTQADTYSIAIRIDDNIEDFLIVEKQGDALFISLDPHSCYTDITFEADVTMPDIEELRVSGGSDGTISGFDFDHGIALNASGGSDVTGSITAGDISFAIFGGSSAALEGSAEILDINVSGGSTLDLEDLPAVDAAVAISGGSDATITVSGTIEGAVSGGSTLYYFGDPTSVDVAVSGGSEIIDKD